MLLALNHRDEAGRFEPMDRSENATTIAHIGNVRWSDYPYTAILALGSGPEDPNIPISPQGKIIVAQGAELFRQHKAPLIIVSGGSVHPAQTRFSEAIHMRQLLIEQYAIPGNAILIDPHARHTTTNFRNADRLIYRYGIPMDRPVLAETLSVAGILNDSFDQRNMKELGYLPYRDKMSISQSVMSFYPVVNGLQGCERSARPVIRSARIGEGATSHPLSRELLGEGQTDLFAPNLKVRSYTMSDEVVPIIVDIHLAA